MRNIPKHLWMLAILSGILQVLPFPIAGPLPAWRTIFCWFALTPLLKALTSPNSTGQPLTQIQGAILAYTTGVIWYLGNCYWIYQTMHLYGGIAAPAAAGILILFCLYLGLYHALFGALIAALRRTTSTPRTLLLSPFIWVAVELARARITGFPWDLLGITQVDNPLLTRLAPITGAYGLSFVIAAVNALWLSRITLKQRRYTRPAITAAAVTIVLVYIIALHRIQTPIQQGTDAYATLVQQNIEVGAAALAQGPPLTTTQKLSTYSALSLFPPTAETCYGIPELTTTHCTSLPPTNSAATRTLQPTNLIVWPEAPNGFLEQDPEFRQSISHLARTAQAPIIVGNIGTDQNSQPRPTLFNSADFIDANGTFTARYDKMHLVPFGEYVPYKKLFFFAGSLLDDVGQFQPGTQRSTFHTAGHTYATFICYESIFGDEIRHFETLGADVLVNISDDGWYGDTSAAWEHLNMVRMRAIENHRWVLRATNTGVTSVVNPYGRVVLAAPRHILTSLRAGFNYEHDTTFYAAHGDLFAYLCALITTLALASTQLRKPA
ncbi:MAG TPA: apolipoprotein N-acyltransferase [Acidobacteriaceae bacterium]|nr:apolipoprotein N-acyltransferase [Acidobacteriaceae bacterium]